LAVAVFFALVVVATGHGLAAEWRSSALYGADVRSLLVDPSNPDRIFAGTSSGQVFVSEDGGEIWSQPEGRLAFPGWIVSDLDLDDHEPRRLWAALWSLWGQDGKVMVSRDLGATWEDRSHGLPDLQVYAVAGTPGHPDRRYAATRSGVYATQDGGLTWSLSTTEFPEIGKVTSLMVDPERPETVYAGSWQRAYRSDDGGQSWLPIFNGMRADSEVFTIEPAFGHSDELWASTCGWIYQGRNRGQEWVRHTSGLNERRTPSLKVLPDGRVLAGTVAGLYVSEDLGRSFTRRTSPELAIMAIAHHPERSRRILLGTEGNGIWRSTDGGETFSPSSRGLTGLRISDVAQIGEELLVAVRYAGPGSGVYISADGGVSFQGQPAALPTVLDLSVANDRVYAATEKGLWERLGGQWRRINEVGEGRAEEVTTQGTRVATRTSEGLFASDGGLFARVDYQHARVRSLVLTETALWVSADDGLFRLTDESNHQVEVPFDGGWIGRVGAEMLIAGTGGIWTMKDGTGAWKEVTRAPVRGVPTGDERYPFVALMESGATMLFDRKAGQLLDLDLPMPARDVTSAILVGDRVLLGTSGYGLVYRTLPGNEAVEARLTPSG